MRCFAALPGVENTLDSQNNLLLGLLRASIREQHDRQIAEEHVAHELLALFFIVTIDAFERRVKSYYSNKLIE